MALAQNPIVDTYFRAVQRRDAEVKYQEQKKLEQERYDAEKKRQDELDKRASETLKLQQEKLRLDLEIEKQNEPSRLAEMYTRAGILKPGYRVRGTEAVPIGDKYSVEQDILDDPTNPDAPVIKAFSPKQAKEAEFLTKQFTSDIALEQKRLYDEAITEGNIRETRAKQEGELEVKRTLLDQEYRQKDLLAHQKYEADIEAIRTKGALDLNRALEVANIRANEPRLKANLSPAGLKKVTSLEDILAKAAGLKDYIETNNGWDYFQSWKGVGADFISWWNGGESDPTAGAIKAKIGTLFTDIGNAKVGAAITEGEEKLLKSFLVNLSHRQTRVNAESSLNELLNEVPRMRDDVYIIEGKKKPKAADDTKPKATITPSGR